MSRSLIIVGAGLSGLFTSLALSAKGIKSILIDQKEIILGKAEDGRAIALTYGSKQFLEQINIWEKIEPFAGKIEQIRVTDNHSPLFLHFDNQCTMGYIVEGGNLLNLALEKVKDDSNITIIDNAKYELLENDLDQAKIKINNKIYQTDLIIAADGKYSSLRQLCKIDFAEKSYNQNALVCKIKHSIPHGNIAQEMFFKGGPFAVLPFKDQHKSGIVWAEEVEIADTIAKLSKDKFNFYINEKLECYLGQAELDSEISNYPLKIIMAKKYFHNHVVLVGDAAHAIHPISGQGFNMGIKDIETLAEIIDKYQQLGFNYGCYQALSEYQISRQNDNRKMAIITDSLNKLFSNNITPITKIRRVGLSVINNMPKLKKFFVEYAMAKKH